MATPPSNPSDPGDPKGAPARSPKAADPSSGPSGPPARPSLGVKVKGSPEDGHKVIGTHAALGVIFGTDTPEQASALLHHCFKVLSRAEAGGTNETEDERLFMLSVVNDIGPRDAVERMLAVQMAATHVALIRAGGRMATCTLLNQLEAHTTAYTKLARTFAAQVEALRKHRSKGQKVTVEHVHVHAGGQAIVGHVEAGSRDRGVGQG